MMKIQYLWQLFQDCILSNTLCIYFEQRFVMGNSLQKKPAARQVVEPPPPDEEFSDEENDENGNLIR